MSSPSSIPSSDTQSVRKESSAIEQRNEDGYTLESCLCTTVQVVAFLALAFFATLLAIKWPLLLIPPAVVVGGVLLLNILGRIESCFRSAVC